jgi:uncharacterized protein YqhQ
MKNCHVTDEVQASPSVIWRQKTDTKSASNGRPHCCQEIGVWLEQVYYVVHVFPKSAKFHNMEEKQNYKLRWMGKFKMWLLLFGRGIFKMQLLLLGKGIFKMWPMLFGREFSKCDSCCLVRKFSKCDPCCLVG